MVGARAWFRKRDGKDKLGMFGVSMSIQYIHTSSPNFRAKSQGGMEILKVQEMGILVATKSWFQAVSFKGTSFLQIHHSKTD